MYRSRGLALLAGVLSLLVLALVGGAPTAQASTDRKITVDFQCDPASAATTPVICLPGGLDEDQAAPLARGETLTFAALVVGGSTGVADASVVIRTPDSLRITGTKAVRRVELPFVVDLNIPTARSPPRRRCPACAQPIAPP